jgi:hypothetical protein
MAKMPLIQEAGRPFIEREDFIETAFELRFQALLRQAWRRRSWHVIFAVPGSGKSLGIKDLLAHSGARKENTGRTYLPILSICSPKNRKDELALISALADRFGVVPKMPARLLHSWLVRECDHSGVELIIADDAQDFSLEHLIYLKELTDNLSALPYERKVGLCLVCATDGETVPLKQELNRPEMLWEQFRWRLEKSGQPYCMVDEHSEEEVYQILAAFEEQYKDQFPDLHLRKWSESIYKWLTHQILDPHSLRRVTMHHLTMFVTSSLRMAAAAGAADVDEAIIEAVADLMILRRGEVIHIDGLPPEDEEPPIDEVHHIDGLPAEEEEPPAERLG